MNIQEYFQQVRTDLAKQDYTKLNSYTLEKPEYFNWVEDIFHKLNVKTFPNDRALIWKYGDEEKIFSFQVLN